MGRIVLVILLVSTGHAKQLVGQDATDSLKLFISIASEGNVQRGNFEFFQTSNRFSLIHHTSDQRWEFNTRNLFLYANDSDGKSQNELTSRNLILYKLSPKWAVFGIAYIAKQFTKKITIHDQFGGGIRTEVMRTDASFLQLGFMGTFTRKTYFNSTFLNFDNNGSPTLKGFFLTPSINGHLTLIPDRLSLNALLWYQLDVTESKNRRFDVEASLFFSLTRNLQLSASIHNFYENIVLSDRKKNDLSLTYGITYILQKKL